MTKSFQEIDVRRTVLVILIHLVPFYLAFRPVTDPDIWWHLAAGRWMWTNGAFPVSDPFSWGEAKPWQAYSWGFEILVYGVERMGGLTGLAVLKASLVMAIIWRLFALLRFLTPDFSRAAVLILVALFALSVYINIRPWLFTIFFTILLFEILFRARKTRNPRFLLWAPALVVLWANIHIQFIYGIGMVALVSAASYCEQKFTDWGSPGDIPFRYYVLTLISMIGASLLTPYHFHLYETAWLYAGQADIYPLIKELRPLELGSAWSYIIFALVFAGFWKLGRGGFRTLIPYVLLPVAAFMALRMLRDGWFLTLIALFLFTEYFAKDEDNEGRPEYRLSAGFRWICASMIAAGVLLIVAGKQGVDAEALQGKLRELYPVEAVHFLMEEQPPGPMFNFFDWGGYLIWNLPGYQVSFDGRTNVYGAEAVVRHVKTWRALPLWKENPILAEARVVVAPREQPLTSLLRVHTGYEVIHEDGTAVIFASRRGSSGRVRGVGEDQWNMARDFPVFPPIP